MFYDRTTFILGAGASWHYGYPTGEALVDELLSASDAFDLYAQVFSQYGQFGLPDFIRECCGNEQAHQNPTKLWIEARRLISEFKQRVSAADPLVIDYFLGHNQELVNIGRLLISWVIHERSKLNNRPFYNYNRGKGSTRDNWCRFLISRLTNDCEKSSDILRNNVNFITFNYDLSLEKSLKKGLQAFSRFEKDDIDEFLKGQRIIHVYGKILDESADSLEDDIFNIVRQLRQNPNPVGLISTGAKLKNLMDLIWASAKLLKVIDPSHKVENESELGISQVLLARSVCIYILGFGFDANNSRRIGLDRLIKLRTTSGNGQSILFTNFQNSNRVSKRAGRLLTGDFRAFLESPNVGSPNIGSYFEMSVRDVYEALSLDFDDLEERRPASS